MATATGEPPSPAAVAVKPDPKDGPDDLTLMAGCFVLMAINQSRADVAVDAVMFFYSTAVSLLLLTFWDKKHNNQLAQGSGYRLMVWLSLVTGAMFISLALIKLLLRPDWLYIAAIAGIFFCATTTMLGFVYEIDRRMQLARDMRSRVCHQEKTADQV